MSNIVGIDVGNSKCVVAIAKPKAVQILMNHDAKYEVPSVVSFTKKRRQIGTDKSSLAMMNPQSTISEIKRLIGRNFDDPGMAEELKLLLPLKTSKADDGGIAIRIDYLGEEQKFTPVEILAMLLCHLKQMIEQNDADLPVSNCVISVPSYFNDLQRVAYLDAAEIAGLIPVQLLNDGTATAVGYGYFKRKLESPVIVVFVDVGQSDTQVTVAQYDREGVKILAHASDQYLGGRDFDRVIYNHFLKEFNTKYEIDVESNPRSTARLMSACEKAKTVLTVNREANISIDCLVRDIGVDGSIERDTFEELSSDLLGRLSATLVSALKNARLENAQINSVELAGSGSRIVAISNVIRNVFGLEPTCTLNRSDCVARGCALRCLLLDGSRGFNDYKVEDPITFSDEFSLGSWHREISEDDTNQNVQITKNGSFNSQPGTSPPNTEKTTPPNVEKAGDKQQITSTPTPGGANIVEAKKRLLALLKHDEDVEEGQRQKNDLETFFYSTRKELNGRYGEYVKKIEKESILRKLDELEPLLSENDGNEKESRFYAQQLLALKKLVKPVEGRYKYFLDCKEATNELCVSITELDRVCKSKKVEFYNYHYSAWLLAVDQLQNNFPKDVDQLPILLGKIKRMTALTTEERCCLTESCKIEDYHQTMERFVGSFREANRYSLVEYQEGDQMKKERQPLIGEICTRLTGLLLTVAPNSFGADEFPTETESLIQKGKYNHVDKQEPSSLDLKLVEMKDEPNASSMELKREQKDKNSERTPVEKGLINSTISDIRVKLSERYEDYIPQLEYEGIEKKLHNIKICLLNGDGELFLHKNRELEKFLGDVEEKYMKEENTGQERVQLLYMIFDSRVKMIMLCFSHHMYGMPRNPRFKELERRASIVCEDVENKFRELKSQDSLDCDEHEHRIKSLQFEIQQFEDSLAGEIMRQNRLNQPTMRPDFHRNGNGPAVGLAILNKIRRLPEFLPRRFRRAGLRRHPEGQED